jgi:hypothetical protein
VRNALFFGCGVDLAQISACNNVVICTNCRRDAGSPAMSAAQPCGRQTGPLTPARQFDWDINDTSVPRVRATAIIISTVQLIKMPPRALLTRGILMNRQDIRERCVENKGSRRVRSEATGGRRAETHT